MQFSDAIWWRQNKSKMADGHHIENRFLVISRRHISRSTRNLEQKWRITCRYRSRDQNCNFRKFKMADGRHFENSLSPYLSRELSDFDYIWYTDTNFHSEHADLTKKIEIFQIQDGGRTPYWKSFFWLYLGAILADQRDILNRNEGSHADIGHVTKSAIFANSRWRTAAILKTALSTLSQPWIIRFRSNLVHIYKFPFRAWKFDIKSKFFKFKMADRRHIENRFGCISAPYWPINMKFGMEMTNHMQIEVTWPKMEIFPNSRWRTAVIFKKVFGVYVILVMNWCSPVSFNRRTNFNEIIKKTANII